MKERSIRASRYSKLFWNEWMLQPENSGYNITFLYEIKGALDAVRLINSLRLYVNCNALLRSYFTASDDAGELFQKFKPRVDGGIEFRDFSNIKENNKIVKDYLDDRINAGFDLTRPPLFRFILVKKGEDNFILLLSLPHIIMDSAFSENFIDDISKFYKNYSSLTGKRDDSHINELSAYMKYEDKIAETRNNEKDLQYWTELLKNRELHIALPFRKKYRQCENKKPECIFFKMDERLSEKILLFCVAEKVSLFQVLCSIWSLLIHNYTQRDEIVLSYSANMRPEQFSGISGCFVNTLPFTSAISTDETFDSFLLKFRRQRRKSREHQACLVSDIVQELYKRCLIDISSRSSFNTGIGETHLRLLRLDLGDDLNVEQFPTQNLSGGDITFEFRNNAGSIECQITYDNNLFDNYFMEKIPHHLMKLSENCIQFPGKYLKDQSFLTAREYRQVIYEWNRTKAVYPEKKTVHELFEEQVENVHDNAALLFGSQKITYRELNDRSNRLAHYIRARYRRTYGKELQPGTLTGICIEPGFEMITGILAILKSGGAYVPIDPDYPEERIQYILKDTKAEFIFTTEKSGGKINLDEEKIIRLDESRKWDGFPERNPGQLSCSSDIAYVIYTSGSTGMPKGVMVEHRSFINYYSWFVSYSSVSDKDIVDFSLPFCFDASITTYLVPLLAGASVVICPKETFEDTNRYKSYLAENQITILKTTPGYFKIFSESGGITDNHLRLIVLGGEQISESSVKKYFSYNPHIKIVNEYGPTETTIGCTKNILESGMENVHSIGQAACNTSLYVLDAYLRPVPDGVYGELYVAGDGVARGYLNREDLTRQRFISNPFISEEDRSFHRNLRLYKTGDLVRRMPDGSLEFAGRNDNQVKIRGFRIELGEIESVLQEFPYIRQAVASVYEQNGRKQICAYYSAEKDAEPNIDDIKVFLAGHLPSYMLPSFYTRIDEIPLTANGKLDRKSLPLPDVPFKIAGNYSAPETEIERMLSEIWCDILKLEKVGVTDDFFHVGGDSIIGIQFISKLRSKGYNLTVKDIFEGRTIEQLAKRCVFAKKSKILAEAGILEGEFDLIPVQKNFFEKELPVINHWNQSFLVKVPCLNIPELEKAISMIVARHDILRATYKANRQRYNKFIKIPELNILDRNNIDDSKLSEVLTEWQSSFDIENGPLWSIGYIYGYNDGSARIYFAAHHLIIDTVSWRILIDDIKDFYNGEDAGDKTSSYRQWAETMMAYEKRHADEICYWENLVESQDECKVPNEKESYYTDITFDVETTTRLLRESNDAYNTEINELLLTALVYSLNKVSGEHTFYITLEGHGREQVKDDIDVSGTVGWFTTAYPVKLELKNNISTSIKHIKETLRNIPARGIGYGALKNYGSSKRLKKHNLPLISFNYLGQFDSTDGYWQITGENSGINCHPDNIDENIINIYGLVTDGKLRFRIESKLSEQDTLILKESFSASISRIVELCISKDKPEYIVSDFPGVNISQELLDILQQQYDIEAIFPATSLQKGFIYYALTNPEDDAYRVQMLFDYRHALDIDNYEKAWHYAVKRYPVLRTFFNWDEDPVQIICKDSKLDFKLIDISSETDSDTKIESIQREDRKIPFEFYRPGLFRIRLIKHSDNYYTLLKSEHHSISDGWSWPVLLNYVHGAYLKLVKEENFTVVEEKCYLDAQEYYFYNHDKVKEFWEDKVRCIEHANDLSCFLTKKVDLDSLRSVINSKEEVIRIDGDLYEKLCNSARQHGVTLNVLLQFAWHKLLSVYAANTQTIVGTTISGRSLPLKGIEDSVGLYINTLPLIIDWDNNNSIKEQLLDIHRGLVELDIYCFAGLASLQKESKRLFHSLFVYENYPSLSSENEPDMPDAKLRYVVEKLDYPVAVTASEREEEGIQLNIKYAAELINVATVHDILYRIKIILEQIVENPEQKHNRINLLSTLEYNRIIYEWNRLEFPAKEYKTIQRLFEEQAEKTPDNIAVVFKDRQLTYKELNEKANQLAHTIRSEYREHWNTGVTNDTIIGMYIERGLQTIIGILGILKSGAAYVPFDTSDPMERLKFKINDCGCKMVLTSSASTEDLIFLADSDTLPLAIDSYWDEIVQSPVTNPENINSPADLLYVIYTSGSTGKPKGVLQIHRNVERLFSACSGYFSFSENDVWVLFHSTSFDFSVWELWGALLYGGKLIIPGYEETRDTKLFYNLLLENRVTVLNQVPSAFYQLGNIDSASKAKLSSLRYVIFGGEALNFAMLKTWFDRYGDDKPELINMYGITETTVHVTLKKITSDDVRRNISNIGRPLNDLTVYVLDRSGLPVPVGVPGELYAGGAGLARGYLNRPELTAEKFIENLFVSEEDRRCNRNLRIYRTGDVARWLPNGELEYLGRCDNQVKIRGFRIELGEIENALSKVPGIKQSAVLVREKQTGAGTGKYLAGYYILEKKDSLNVEKIMYHLKQCLPDYMIPAAFIELTEFPLTGNGKLDRQALPEPGFEPMENYTAPASELEEKLCGIWQEVLGIERAGVTDDFFRIGGDSILSIVLSSKIRKAGYECLVKDIFENRNIRSLSKILKNKREMKKNRTESGTLEGRFNLLPIQKWFFAKVRDGEFNNVNHWNQSFIVKVPELEIEKLENVILSLVEHHDILRIGFSYDTGTYIQKYNTVINIPELKVLDINKISGTEELHKTLTDWQSNFNIKTGPLWQIGYIHGYTDATARIYFALHHLIVDAVSWRILIEDTKALYDNEKLPDKTTSYRQWASAVEEYADDNKEEIAYWKSIQYDQKDYSQSATGQTTSSELRLDCSVTGELIKRANQAYNTEINDLLLTALGYALSKWSGSNVVHITLEGHGREHIKDDIDLLRTAGWFTIAYPVRLEIYPDSGRTIKAVKESLRAIPNKGLGYGALKYNLPNDQSDLLKELPLINFNYLGQFDSQDGLWQIVAEDSGDSIGGNNYDYNIININGMIIDGRLSFHITTRLSQDETRKLVASLTEQLKQITKHCIGKIEAHDLENTPSDFGINISRELLDKLQSLNKSDNNNIQAIYPAGSLQQGFIYHALSQEEDDAYRVQFRFDYYNRLDKEKYKTAWALAIQNYPVLRTAFNWEEEIIQIIHGRGNLNFTYYDISEEMLTASEEDERITQILREDRKQKFNLAKPTQLRLCLIKLGENRYTLLKSIHHSIIDGWSWPVLLNKVHGFYKQLCQGIKPVVNEEKTYPVAQKYYMKHEDEVKDYWNRQIATIEQINDLNIFLNYATDMNSIKFIKQPGEENLQISGDLYRSLKQLSKTLGITLNTVLQFAWHKLIQSYTRDTQTIVGTTVSGRNIPVEDIENSVGLYINTLPLIIDWTGQDQITIAEHLKYIHQKITELNTFCYANLAELQRNGKRLFHSLFVFENYPLLEKSQEEGSEVVKINVELRKTVEKLDYPLALTVFEKQGYLTVNLKYAGEYLEKEKGIRLLGQLKMILQQMVIPEKNISEITLLTSEEYQKAVYDWNRTETLTPEAKTAIQLFEEQAAERPENTAVVFEDQQLTYKGLDEKANHLASAILDRQVEAQSIIVLFLDRDITYLASMLAVWKSNCTFVPIHPQHPYEKNATILKQFEHSLLITSSKHYDKASKLTDKDKILVPDDLNSVAEVRADFPPADGEDIAYIIFTSGSTGTPKGAMVQHKGMLNHLLAKVADFGLSDKDRVAQTATQTFDVSVWQYMSALLVGGTTVVFSDEKAWEPEKLLRLIADEAITVFESVPSHMSVILDELEQHSGSYRLPCLKWFIMNGEGLPPEYCRRWFKLFPCIPMANVYGPTECSDDVTHYRFTSVEDCSGVYVPIGKPVRNTKLYVLDKYLQPVPVGVPGELYVSGVCVGKGYVNSDEKTKANFLENPFRTDEEKTANRNEFLYKTGDLVRRLPDGNLEYLNRVDFQVKIRGQRIETGEIESQILKYEPVRNCVVTVYEDKTKKAKWLAAYYTLNSSNEFRTVEVKDFLADKLPDYMVPTFFTELDSLPVTASGKIDRNVLPAPDIDRIISESYISPRTETEKSLSGIWREVLKLDKVGVYDNFFSIGGHSLKATLAVSRINRKYGVDVPVKTLFEYQTLEKLSAYLDRKLESVEIF